MGNKYQKQMKHLTIIKKQGLKETDQIEEALLNRNFTISDVVSDKTDILLSLGGDGTILSSIQLIHDKDIPILGLNFGHLGFLTSELSSELDQLIDLISQEEYYLEKRNMLSVSWINNNNETQNKIALNEVVVRSLNVARITELEVLINNEFVSKYNADGVMISTPTGSTAYSLSAGGPLVEPELPVHILTPICPHSLSQRPLIFDNKKTTTINILKDDHALISLDGQSNDSISKHKSITITKSKKPIKIIRFQDETFYRLIRKKLYWGKE